MRTSDRTVSVRGVSEREARADLAIWPLHIVAADNDLAAANARIQQQLSTLEEVTAVLRLLTEAVRLAGALVGLAAAG